MNSQKSIEIISADDDVAQYELLSWADLSEKWDKYELYNNHDFLDLAERAKHIDIETKQWGGEVPGLSGTWYTIYTDNEKSLRKELRGLVAEVILEEKYKKKEEREKLRKSLSRFPKKTKSKKL